jgi:cell shape-determining protein MreD
MVPSLIGIPFLALTVLLQSSIVSRISMGFGKADLVLLVIICWTLQDRVTSHWQWAVIGGLLMSLISAVPFYSYLFTYLVVVAVCRFIKRSVWQIPVVTLLLCILFGTLIENGISWAALTVSGVSLPLMKSITSIILPSILFNTILGIPVYYGITDFAGWVYPKRFDYE